jgi:hypothetical protein
MIMGQREKLKSVNTVVVKNVKNQIGAKGRYKW